ncbi:MAG: Aspartate racemase [candidate division TM6 bacterium GW2011_GWF2_37_49]|nr:MAG: Aspartate racemase [candidate division TM6 bacterium GW2011_GWF2_37_49]
MKTIGLLGGTGWSSTMGYYTLLNELVGKRLGGYHSAKILLKSIDYHDIMSNYGKNHEKIADILHAELIELMSLNPDCIIICCNSLHKYYDLVRHDLYPDADIPVFHAVELVAQHINQQQYKKVLLLATKSTMEDGFFAKTLENHGIEVVIPDLAERDGMQKILSDELIYNVVTQDSKHYFSKLIEAHPDCQSVVLGCTEFPLLVDSGNSVLPIINPVQLQCAAAVEFALE